MANDSFVETGPLFWRPVKGGSWHSLPLPKGLEALRPGRSVLLYLGRLGSAPVVGRFKAVSVRAYGTRRRALLPTDAARIAPDLPLPGGDK
ncbi:MAG: hypothetical protein ACOYXN_03240 [Acidobacteriota bacterium]